MWVKWTMDVNNILQELSALVVIVSFLIPILIYAVRQDLSIKWMKKELKPNGGSSLRDAVDQQCEILINHGDRLTIHTEQLESLKKETAAQNVVLERIDKGTGDVNTKVVAIHAAEGQKLSAIQETVTAAKDQAEETAKAVKETLKKHG